MCNADMSTVCFYVASSAACHRQPPFDEVAVKSVSMFVFVRVWNQVKIHTANKPAINHKKFTLPVTGELVKGQKSGSKIN